MRRTDGPGDGSPHDDDGRGASRTAPHDDDGRGASRTAPAVVLVLGALTAVAPISTTIYLPGLPEIADDLGTSASAAQLTVSAFVAGLAVGQLVSGPLSDRFGRRRPLLAGLGLYIAATLLCAAAPSVELLYLARFAQGLCGAAGIVIARATVRDMHTGAAAVRLFALLVLVTGVMPVLAPLLGGQLLALGSWRTIFLGVAVIAGAMTLATAVVLPETLPPERRHRPSLAATFRTPVRLLRHRTVLGCALACGMAYAAMLSYMAGSSFALQEVYGLSPQTYSAVFALTALGIIVASRVSARLADRIGARGILIVGVAVSAAGGLLSLAGVLADVPVEVLLPALLLTVAGHGFVLPSATALALAEHPNVAGSASGALGLVQYTTGAVSAPLVGVAGEGSAVPWVAIMALLGLGAAASARWLVPRRPAVERGAAPTPPAPAAGTPAP